MLTDQLYVVLFIKEEVFNLQVSVENKNYIIYQTNHPNYKQTKPR